MEIADFLSRAAELRPDAKVTIVLAPEGRTLSVEWCSENNGEPVCFQRRLLIKELLFDEAIEAFFSSCNIGMKTA